MRQLIFGPFTIEAFEGRLFRDGVEVRLRPQALKALTALAVHRSRYVGVTRDDDAAPRLGDHALVTVALLHDALGYPIPEAFERSNPLGV